MQHVRPVIPTWGLRLFLTPLNASIIKPCCFLAMEDPSVSGWLRAHREGGYERAGAQMALCVSGRAARKGGALTSGHDWIRQLSFASPKHLWTVEK
ncbi:hypothetical protein CesoFtcFv8_021770 [Champsocephalus esox]|uniref:Secreted protein n=1 Tax=Champsocephalus esox TaxID=159716 RepID=A0AAN8B964_9TELE|nr:hypothetical protein CesoFtcFv8_021770 [Champsocephalus esox]